MNLKNRMAFTLIELLGVIVILGILLTISVQSFNKYNVKSVKVAYNAAEKSLKSAGKTAIIDCLSAKIDDTDLSRCASDLSSPECFCLSHDTPEEQYEYLFMYLDELVNSGYINSIKNPKNTEELCDSKSYVYVLQNSDTSTVNNVDYKYKTCLICGDYRSSDCLDDDKPDQQNEKTDFNALCKITTDLSGQNVYDGSWTNGNLYLHLSVDDETKAHYGVSYFNYKIGSSSYKIGASSAKAIIELSDTINDLSIVVTARDGVGKITKEVNCGANVKIDKEMVKNVKINAKKSKSGTEVVSNAWSNEDLIIVPTVNPKNTPSGYLYKYYKNNVPLTDWISDSNYTISESGVYKVEVKNRVTSQSVMSNEYIAKIDKVKPSCTVVVDGSPKKYGSYYIESINLKIGSTSDDYSGVSKSNVDISSITNSVDNKVITGTVNDFAGNVNTCKLSVNVDVTTPVIKANSSPLRIGTVDYNFTSNIVSTFGSSGGTTSCDPDMSKKVGSYIVTCTATGNNGKQALVTLSAIHSYSATNASYTATNSSYTATPSTYSYTCQTGTYYTCHGHYDGGMTGECNCSGAAYCPSGSPCWCHHPQYGTCTSTTYSCPNGGTLSGSTCVKYTCPDGGTLSGTTCVKYTCPDGGILNGTTCYY